MLSGLKLKAMHGCNPLSSIAPIRVEAGAPHTRRHQLPLLPPILLTQQIESQSKLTLGRLGPPVARLEQGYPFF